MYIFCCSYCFCVVHFRLTLDESALQNNTLLHYITCMATVTHTRLLCTVHGHCHPHPSPLHRAWPLSPTPVSSAPCMATVTHTRLLYTVHSHCHPHPSPLHRAWPLSPTPCSCSPASLSAGRCSGCHADCWTQCRHLRDVGQPPATVPC